jgi:hypothetical protein
MKNDEKNYAWIGVCPICNQGRQIVARQDRTQQLYIVCEECESEWRSPQEARDINSATRGVFGKHTFLTRDELLSNPWMAYLHG